MRRFTNAPESYDAATTTTVRVVGRLSKRGGDVLREVEIGDEEDLDWQTDRYLSGLYECWVPEDFDTLAYITGLVSA
jgi:hypothetical protein